MNSALPDNPQRNAALIKVAFFDMDGTIIQGTHHVSPRVKDSLSKLSNHGIKVCLATGRSLFAAKKIAEYLGINQPCMFSSGAYIINPIESEPLLAEYLDPNDSKELSAALRSGGFYTEIYIGDDYFVESKNERSSIHAEYIGKEPVIGDMSELSSRPNVLKLIAMVQIGEEERRLRELLSSFSSVEVGYAAGDSHPEFMFANIHSKKASRDRAFDFFLEHFNVKASETIAFGDSESDVPFFRRAGISVAMGNATLEVQKTASIVTDRVEDEGVPNAIQRIFGL